ncbi:hypothetical protein Klosneuvirus_4_63 [Klosneuvirus KNV1]|uniref:Uncharacterized protein n=1 Tax=Klosneuvirus KNV1 TaxID=1977640 RepID=A0A1V0SKV2_9VIRU|nr:hypothetical protein Klosneuvirus_4_63 [Klosneuvirus KNV1]
MKVDHREAMYFINKVGLKMNEELFTVDDLIKGMNVELEHGKKDRFTNVTNNNIIITGKIALAHLNEFPDYYKRLEKLEKKAEKYWKNKPKKRYVLRK